MRLSLTSQSDIETARYAAALAPTLRPGDCVCLTGAVGAGKSVFARALIQTLMAQTGHVEDVPSPTFTLVQVYAGPECEIWHADLYRLGDASEVIELGLLEALTEQICVIEWPARLGAELPARRLDLALDLLPEEMSRVMTLVSHGDGWSPHILELDAA